MEKLLIIDGNNLLFQMFYGMPSKIYNKSGKTIHATIGFVSAILRLKKMIQASKIVVVFDKDGSDERKEIYQDYKANRNIDWDSLPSDEVPFNEEVYIKKCLDYMGVKYIQSSNMEADDLIASLAILFKEKARVFICSYDSDFFQLIDKNVSVIRYKGKNSKVIDEKTFYETHNLTADKYVFYKCLVGDASDNIKGIPQIGKVRALKIVNNCSDFEQLLVKANDILPLKIALTIPSYKDVFFTNKKIITLTYKPIINYHIREFGFNEIIFSLTNSEILSNNKVFD